MIIRKDQLSFLLNSQQFLLYAGTFFFHTFFLYYCPSFAYLRFPVPWHLMLATTISMHATRLCNTKHHFSKHMTLGTMEQLQKHPLLPNHSRKKFKNKSMTRKYEVSHHPNQIKSTNLIYPMHHHSSTKRKKKLEITTPKAITTHHQPLAPTAAENQPFQLKSNAVACSQAWPLGAQAVHGCSLSAPKSCAQGEREREGGGGGGGSRAVCLVSEMGPTQLCTAEEFSSFSPVHPAPPSRLIHVWDSRGGRGRE